MIFSTVFIALQSFVVAFTTHRLHANQTLMFERNAMVDCMMSAVTVAEEPNALFCSISPYAQSFGGKGFRTIVVERMNNASFHCKELNVRFALSSVATMHASRALCCMA